MADLNLIPHPLTGTPFGAALDVCVILAALTWLASVITREYRGWTASGKSVRRSTA